MQFETILQGSKIRMVIRMVCIGWCVSDVLYAYQSQYMHDIFATGIDLKSMPVPDPMLD